MLEAARREHLRLREETCRESARRLGRDVEQKEERVRWRQQREEKVTKERQSISGAVLRRNQND